jgi:parvulin-like peptidyl-prolyl isomerase
VFAAKPGDISDPIGTPRGVAIAFVESTRPAGVATLADVRERVEQDVKRQKAAEEARVRLAQLMAGAPSVDAIAAKGGTRAPQEVTVTHQGSVAGLTGETGTFTDAALKAPVGAVQGPIAVGDGAVAFQVVEQKRVTPEEIAKNRAALADRLRQQQARQLRSVLVERLRKTAEIEINDEITRPTTPAPTPTAGL